LSVGRALVGYLCGLIKNTARIMPFDIFLLVLLSSFIHATWNYFAKTIPGGGQFVWLLAVIMSLVLAPFAIGWVWYFGFDWSLVNCVVLVVSGLMHLVYFMVLQKGYSVGDLSVVYPLARGSGPIFSTFGAVLLLGETVALRSVGGLILVIVGVLLVSGMIGGQTVSDPEKRRLGVIYGISTGVMIAAYTVLDGYAVKVMGITPVLIEFVSHPLRVAVLAPVAFQKWPEIKALWHQYYGRILIVAIISPISFLMVLYAMKHAPVHLIAPTREMSIVFGVIFGARLLTEENFKERLIGSCLILMGILAL